MVQVLRAPERLHPVALPASFCFLTGLSVYPKMAVGLPPGNKDREVEVFLAPPNRVCSCQSMIRLVYKENYICRLAAGSMRLTEILVSPTRCPLHSEGK